MIGCALASGWMRSAWNIDSACGDVGHALQHERHQRGALAARDLGEHRGEALAVAAAVVRRQLHADDQHLGARGLGRLRHRDAGWRASSRAAGRAARRCRRARSRPGRACAARSSAGRRARPPAGGVAADAGVDDRRADACSRARRCSSSATQPLPRSRPYSADRLSPTTRIVCGAPRRGRAGEGIAGGQAASASASATVREPAAARRRRHEDQPSVHVRTHHRRRAPDQAACRTRPAR